MPITPIPVTKDLLLAVLREMTARVEADDSYDGSLTWSSTYGPPCTQCGGSGGLAMQYGEPDDVEHCPLCDGMMDQPIPDGFDFWLTANCTLPTEESSSPELPADRPEAPPLPPLTQGE